MPTTPASSSTTRVHWLSCTTLSHGDCTALATTIPVSPAPSRVSTSTAFPVGASNSTVLWKRWTHRFGQSLQRGGLARTRRGIQWLHQSGRVADVLDYLFLLQRDAIQPASPG